MVKKYENFATSMWHFNFQVYQKSLNKYMSYFLFFHFFHSIFIFVPIFKTSDTELM